MLPRGVELTGFSFEGDNVVVVVLGLLMGIMSSFRGVFITSNDDVSLEIEFRVFSSNFGSDRSLNLSSITSISASELSKTDCYDEFQRIKITGTERIIGQNNFTLAVEFYLRRIHRYFPRDQCHF